MLSRSPEDRWKLLIEFKAIIKLYARPDRNFHPRQLRKFDYSNRANDREYANPIRANSRMTSRSLPPLISQSNLIAIPPAAPMIDNENRPLVSRRLRNGDSS